MQSECKNIDRLTCGICVTALTFNAVLEKKVQEHPILKILICQNCYENFDMTDNDVLCYWCKISEETIVKCMTCSTVYCKKCLEKNFNEDELKLILRKKQWLCFTCNPVPLMNRRDSCKKVLNWLANHEFSSKNLNNYDHINMNNNELDLPKLRQALINKCTQLAEMGFQLIARSISHMTLFKSEDTTLSNTLEAANYQYQLMLSVIQMCTLFNVEIDDMKKMLENSNGEISQEPEVTSGDSYALSCGKKENKINKGKKKNKLSLVSNTAYTSDIRGNDDTEEEPQPTNPEILSNGTMEKSRKSDNDDSNSEETSLFSQETVYVHVHNNDKLVEESMNCVEKKIDNYNCEPATEMELLLNDTNGVITDENASESTILLSNDVNIPNLQDENPSIDDNDSISEEREGATAKSSSNDGLSDDQDKEEVVPVPSNAGLCSTKEIDDRYIEMFKQYDDLEFSESDQEDLNSLSEKGSSYSTPDELQNVGHISRTLPNLPSAEEPIDLNGKIAENSKSDSAINEKLKLPSCVIMVQKLEDTIISYLNGYNTENNENSQSLHDKEEREVERLANLNAIGVKRKRNTNSEEEVVKSFLKKSKVDGNDSDSTMSLSLSLDENDEANKIVQEPLEENISEIVHDTIIDDCVESTERAEGEINQLLTDSDFDSDLIKDSDEENDTKSKKTKRLKQSENKENEPIKEEPQEEKTKVKRPKWRNDPLLNGKLNDDTDSDGNNSGNCEEQLKRKRKKDEARNENHISKTNDQSCSDSASEGENVPSLINVFSSDSDSSIEFVKEFKNKNSKKPPVCLNFSSDCETDSEEEVNLSMNKGRKNIRSICSVTELSVLTKTAMDAEKSRRERVNNKEKLMSNYLNSEDLILDIDEVTLAPTIIVNSTLCKRLKDHQKDGVRFMYNCCYESVNNGKKNEGTGCILAHTMGLGKTFQVVTLIYTLFTHEITNTKRVLVVCPLSVVLNWRDEFREAFNSINDHVTINIFYISDKCDITKKVELIKKWRKTSGTLIMGYEAYQRFTLPKEKQFSSKVTKQIRSALVNPGPDLVILDEGHLLKNGKIARTRALMAINTKRRIILTGTPLQNNLKEYYYMVNFIKPNYLGSLKEYSNRFMNPITNGQYHDSTERDIKQMKKRSHILNKLLNVYVIQRYGILELEKYLPKRHDHVLFIELHSVQIKLYTKYIANLESSAAEKNNLFNNFNFLQFICSHPITLLMKEKASIKAHSKSNCITTDSPDLKEVTGLPPDWWNSICPDDFKNNIDYGPKYKVMMAIIKECEAVGDKVLIFSNSMIDLEAIEYFLHQNSTSTSEWKRDLDYFRMDGSVSQAKRSDMCHSFNDPKNKRIRVFLLSYRVACLGINLMAANRVILMNVSWNPAIDSQSIFRMYRFGQVKECFVYRLVAMGAMEEVLYERQITKLAVARRVIEETQVSRHYSCSDLQVMYRFNFQTNQPRPMLHVSKDAILMKIIEKCPNCVFKYHEHQSLLEDRPDEGLNADDMKSAWEEYYREDEEKTTEQHRKQFKNAPVAGPSGITNLANTAVLSNQQSKGFPNAFNNTTNKSITSTPGKVVPLSIANNNGPSLNFSQAPNFRPNLNPTLYNNFRSNANNIRMNNSYPQGNKSAPSCTTTTASQINSSLTTINPFHINKQVSRTINYMQKKELPKFNTIARAIHNNNMQSMASNSQQNSVSVQTPMKKVNLSRKEEHSRLLTSIHSNSEITISTIGDPRPDSPNLNSNMDSVILID